MDAEIQGCLKHLDDSYKAFEHNNQPLHKWQVKEILEYGDSQGYTLVSQIPDEEINRIINSRE